MVAKILPATRNDGRPWWSCSTASGSASASRRASSAVMGVVGAERPQVALGVAKAELARAVTGVGELAHDLGARLGRPRVERVGVADGDVQADRARARVGRAAAEKTVLVVGAEHDQSFSELQLCVADAAVTVAVDITLLGAERFGQPGKSSVGVAVAQCWKDVLS